jgi:NAD(P)-dependent dehydrogenase (short-subunit alcohol dehydrogenase family)
MKSIVITGANRGIGLELTKLFSKDNTVYAVCRSEFPVNNLNENIHVINIDLLDESKIKAFADSLDDEQIGIDLLINNAGMAGGSSDGIDSEAMLDLETVTKVLATNVAVPMTVTRYLTSALKRSSHPSVISISSRMGTHTLLNEYSAEWWPYSSSKAALSFAVAAFAINEPTIKFISIHPGWVKTRMGGNDAPMEKNESAKHIQKLYENINSLDSGKMYNYDGQLMDW